MKTAKEKFCNECNEPFIWGPKSQETGKWLKLNLDRKPHVCNAKAKDISPISVNNTNTNTHTDDRQMLEPTAKDKAIAKMHQENERMHNERMVNERLLIQQLSRIATALEKKYA